MYPVENPRYLRIRRVLLIIARTAAILVTLLAISHVSFR
jgi:hypothetical protein